jgi:hypothetical protein
MGMGRLPISARVKRRSDSRTPAFGRRQAICPPTRTQLQTGRHYLRHGREQTTRFDAIQVAHDMNGGNRRRSSSQVRLVPTFVGSGGLEEYDPRRNCAVEARHDFL